MLDASFLKRTLTSNGLPLFFYIFEGTLEEGVYMAKFTIEIVRDQISSYGATLLSEEYINAREKLDIECRNGHIYQSTLGNFKSVEGRCPICTGQGKLTIDYVKHYIEVETNSGYTLLSETYKNNRSKLSFLCDKGHEYKASFTGFKQGNRCPICEELNKVIRQTHSYEYVKNYIEVESKSGYELIDSVYIDNQTPLKMRCNNGHDIKICFNNFKNNRRCSICHKENNKGENHHSWKTSISDEEREIGRRFYGYNQWRTSVYERDKYTCQCCGDNKGGNLNAHHLDGYDWCKEKRIDVDNGVTLCETCHTDFHKNFGFGGNTKEQFEQWFINKANPNPKHPLTK